MKRLNTLFPFLLCIVIAITTVSCEKGEDGAQGPEGPAGPAGPPGAPGPAGSPGTANVIYSNWITTPEWKPDTVMEGSVVVDTLGWFVEVAAAKLDAEILNKGEIKTYINLGTTAAPVVYPLPYNDGFVLISPVFYTGGIQFYSNLRLNGLPIRYVLIPGGAPARLAINWHNYNEVKAYLKLKD